MKCRFCRNNLKDKILDLGKSPPSNAYLRNKSQFNYEKYFPLKLYLCKKCYLVQTQDFNKPENYLQMIMHIFQGPQSYLLNMQKNM